jgi:hypothetical protein
MENNQSQRETNVTAKNEQRTANPDLQEIRLNLDIANKRVSEIAQEIDRLIANGVTTIEKTREANVYLENEFGKKVDELTKKLGSITPETTTLIRERMVTESADLAKKLSHKLAALHEARIQTDREIKNERGPTSLEEDGRYRKFIEEKSFEYLKNQDARYYNEHFSGIAPSGYLLDKQGQETVFLPSQNICIGWVEVQNNAREAFTQKFPEDAKRYQDIEQMEDLTDEAEMVEEESVFDKNKAKLAEIYATDPAESIRANLAAAEYDIKLSREAEKSRIISIARGCEKVTMTPDGRCDTCGQGPNNFCACGKTFLSNQMIQEGRLVKAGYGWAEEALSTINQQRDELDKIEDFKPTHEECVEADTSGNTFIRYSEDLGISADDLRGQQILDVGAGEREFSAHCLRENISTRAHSLDLNLIYGKHPGLEDVRHKQKTFLNRVLSPDIRAQLDKLTKVGDREVLPYTDDSFDIIVSNSAMPGFGESTDPAWTDADQSIKKTLGEMIRVLKSGKEARLYPFILNPTSERVKRWAEIFSNELAALETQGLADVTIEPTGETKSDGTAARLIIKKKETAVK